MTSHLKNKKFANNKTNSSKEIKSLDKLADSFFISVLNDLEKQRKARRKRRKVFEEEIYQKWKKPIDLLEGLIDFCSYAGEKKRRGFNKGVFNNKHAALVRLHARSLLISNEIVTLVRSGYADGAHARWRSLFELEVIAGFLSEQEKWVSERYLKHETMRGYKQLRNYQEYCSRLGYEPFNEEELKHMQKNHDLMIEKYGKDFKYKAGWEWIPYEIVNNRTLQGLAKFVKVDHFIPYYDLSSNEIHGGPKGFNHMGLPKHRRNRILLTGPSIFGMADSLHSTAISLQRATTCLIKQEATASNVIEMKTIMKIVDEIGQSSLAVHRDLEPNNHKGYK
jgi:hypothetical protein